MRRRKILVVAAAATLIATLGVGVAIARIQERRNVVTQGANYFEPNTFIQSTLRFDPGTLMVLSGDTIRFNHGDETFEPHTATFVRKADLPTSVDEVFACQEPTEPCGEALEKHFGEGTRRLEDDDDDEFGIDAPGDSVMFFAGQGITAEVTAPAGTALYFLCAVHPWMQGSIKVEA